MSWKHRLRMRAKTIGIDATCSLSNLNLRIVSKGGEITAVDRIWYFLEDRIIGPAFKLFYEGSREEIQAVFDGEIPPYYMSARQKAAMLAPSQHECSCHQCMWRGTYDEVPESDRCPGCGEIVFLEPIQESNGATVLTSNTFALVKA